ncbi:hypothetical protein Bpfe_017791 [Biomphalaria pfeifferi]|uniref:EGF-like domain-containing protein n=1 Tax=Biomphalaria pfeifferi TaxID=112525 RepID=A0AAD8BDL6_BIOPF|nr:hypothetical protein Bpfe_017791 [Biomphalaria pfeifferi]
MFLLKGIIPNSVTGDSKWKLKENMNGYQAEIMSCTTDKVARTEKLQEPIVVVSQVHCAQFCAKELLCDMALYQTFANDSKSCTLLQQLNLSNSSDRVDFSSVKCSLILSNPCLNGGLLENEICVCKPEFSGERCEYKNPSCCNGQWRLVYTSSPSVAPPVYENQDLHHSKLRYRDAATNATVVLTAAYCSCTLNERLSFESHTTLDKSNWNSTTSKRRFLHFRSDGGYQSVSFNFAKGSYSTYTGTAKFDFFVRDPIFQLQISYDPLNCVLLRSALSEGFQHFEQTTTALYDDENIVFQISELYQTVYYGGHFTSPQTWYNVKTVWGKTVSAVEIAIGKGTFENIEDDSSSGNVILDTCWMALSLDKFGRLQPKKLASYLQRGHSVKVFFDNVYYNVIEVVGVEGQLFFVLKHHMTKTGVEPLDTLTYGVKTIVSSAGKYERCAHVMEGETVKATSSGVTTNLRWFVDTKTWTLAYSVASNNSIEQGSLSVLAQAVLDGRDVRVWVKWLLYDKSRYMETQQSSVTPSGKVSTEGVVTWATSPQAMPNVTLCPQCGYEYVLVTSDGYVEAVTYNVFTPAVKMVVNDVIITWFAN